MANNIIYNSVGYMLANMQYIYSHNAVEGDLLATASPLICPDYIV